MFCVRQWRILYRRASWRDNVSVSGTESLEGILPQTANSALSIVTEAFYRQVILNDFILHKAHEAWKPRLRLLMVSVERVECLFLGILYDLDIVFFCETILVLIYIYVYQYVPFVIKKTSGVDISCI